MRPFGDACVNGIVQGIPGDAADFLHQLLGFTHIHKSAGDDVGTGEDGAGVRIHGGHHHDQTVLRQMTAVAEHDVAHVAHAVAVHQHPAGGNGAGPLAGVLIQFQHLADVAHKDVIRIHTHVFCQFLVLHQMAVFAVDGHKVLRLHQRVQKLDFLLAGVAGYVYLRILVIYIDAAAVHFVDDVAHQLLVAGDGVGRQHHQVTGGEFHLIVIGEGHTVQSGHGLALGAGGDDGHLAGLVAADFVDVDQHLIGHGHVSQFHGGPHHVQHAASGDGYLAAVFGAVVDDLLYTVYVGGEGGHDHPLGGVVHEDQIQGCTYLPLGGGESGPAHVGGFAHEEQNALLAVFADAGQIDHVAVDGRYVDLEVTGVEHHAHGGGDGDAAGIRNGVVHADEFRGEGTQFHGIAGGYGVHLHLVGQTLLCQLILQNTQRQAGTVDGRIDGAEHVGQGSDVILVSVGQKNTADAIRILFQIGDVRDDQIYTKHVIIGECQTAVDDDYVIAVFQNGQIFADFVQSAQHHDAELRCVLFFCHKAILSIICYVEIWPQKTNPTHIDPIQELWNIRRIPRAAGSMPKAGIYSRMCVIYGFYLSIGGRSPHNGGGSAKRTQYLNYIIHEEFFFFPQWL